ncbi:hypothetical protein BOTBODRAFT_27829 [Botryobasidium botryosum FD-172 SS1]|uniref:Uncharacterized protein n=1 Tax=Botryobasidium botryosum (strain FD-172 SS1) TaxID=930990 RepID=A0A067MUE8_BOTB1|nr:hypothetical protein BOTBODRAFT_27829 [Botryobasidium botryosum FD-172 SS1]
MSKRRHCYAYPESRSSVKTRLKQKLNRDLTRTGCTAPMGFSFGYVLAFGSGRPLRGYQHLSCDPSGSIYAKSSCDVGSHDTQIRESESSVARRLTENAKT